MFPPLQWDELHLKVWSWLKGEPFQKHMEFKVECDLVQYQNKIETTFKNYTLNLFFKIVLKVFKDHTKRTTY
jgi:hypothetical protein